MSDLSKKIGIIVEAQDLASGRLSKVKGEVAGIGQAGQVAGGHLGSLVGHANRAGSALSTLKGRVMGFAGAAGAMLGFGGILGLSAAFKDAISKAQEFGESSLRLSQVTGLGIDTTSRLVDALDYFGISAETQIGIAGKYEKAIAGIASTHVKAIAFQKQYGLAITDSKGHVLDYNKQLLASADFFNNKTIPASTKALALSKLYGKTWQDLIPILAQGRSGIEKSQADAMHMSQADLDAITANKEATRKWNDELADLETQIGLKLLPTLTDGLRGVTGWLSTHEQDVSAFFTNGLAAAKTFAGVAANAIGALSDGWGKIPAPMRDLLVKGVVADRAVKFTLGFDPIKMVLGGAAGALFKRGGSPASPLWVRDVGGGKGGSGGGGKGGGYGISTFLTDLAIGLTIADVLHELGLDKPIQDFANQYKKGSIQTDENGDPIDKRVGHLKLPTPDPKAVASNAKLQLIAERAEQIRNAIHDKKLAVTVAPHVTVKDYAATHVRIFENGDATSSTTSQATASTDSRFAGYTQGLAAGGRYYAGRPRLVGENGIELDVPDHSGRVFNATETQRMLRSGYDGGAGGADAGFRELAAEIRRLLATPSRIAVRAHVSARQTEGALHRQEAYGPTRARQLAFSPS